LVIFRLFGCHIIAVMLFNISTLRPNAIGVF
jgi:hypothetical protein